MLLRLAGWGFCAALALGVTVTLSQTDRGAERIQQAVASLYNPAGDPHKPTAQIAEKVVEPAPDPQDESRRITRQMELQIQRLAADRDRLASRVAMLERNFDDITGSVKQIATARATPPPAAEPAKIRDAIKKEDTKEAAVEAAKEAAAPPRPANDNAPPPPSVADAAAPAAVAAPPVRLSALPQIKGTAKDAGTAPQTQTERKTERKDAVIREPLAEPAVTAPDTLPAKLDFAIDLGGASTIEGLRGLWTSTKAAHAPLLDTLQPAAILRPTGKNGAPQLRLMAGPFADAGAAAAVCRAFAPGRGICRPFAFDGQKLPLR